MAFICFVDGDEFVNEVNELVGSYVFSPQRNMAFFASPFQLKKLSSAKGIFTEITYTGNRDFPYLLNMVPFNEDSLQCK